jgi:SH3-like domain-containing protein
VRGVFLVFLAALLPMTARAADEKPFRPHYVSQRAGLASLRQGPGYSYRVLWVYRHRGYPFKESARFDVWRRITAIDGTVGWMNGQLLSDERTVLVTGKGRAEIRKRADTTSQVVGLAEPEAILELKACEPEFCRVDSGRVDGWIARDRIWGVDPGETFK